MQGAHRNVGQQSFLNQDLRSMLDSRHPLYRLAERMPWSAMEQEFGALYAAHGRPSVPVRVMVSLLVLKHMYDLSDENVVARWMENPFWQFFSGREHYSWSAPCDPCELVRFRQRIGPGGAEMLLKWSVGMHGPAADATTVVVDTTVQEKNTAHPTDSGLYQRMADECVAIAKREGIALRRSYRRARLRLRLKLRTRNFPKARAGARRATQRLRIIAGRLLRDLLRKCSVSQRAAYADRFDIFARLLESRRAGSDAQRIYSLHEPQIYCMGKGKDRVQYEFGTKVSIAITASTNIIVGALNLSRNIYDGHTIPDVLEQIKHISQQSPSLVLADRGYRGVHHDGSTRILTPDALKQSCDPVHKDALRRLLNRRSAVEPVIGHLKSDHRLCRNFLRGWLGDEMNVLLAAAGWNFRKLLRRFSALWAIFQICAIRIRIAAAYQSALPTLSAA